MLELSNEEIQRLSDIIIIEGFEYAFLDYSDFKEVKSKKFHELRKQFINSKKELENFLLENGVEFEE